MLCHQAVKLHVTRVGDYYTLSSDSQCAGFRLKPTTQPLQPVFGWSVLGEENRFRLRVGKHSFR